jgi:hypothetical protein
MTYKGLAKGKIIELEEPLPFCEGQPVTVSVELSKAEEQGSPLAILQVLQQLPDLPSADIDELERVIKAGSLPVNFAGEFDHNKPDNVR